MLYMCAGSSTEMTFSTVLTVLASMSVDRHVQVDVTHCLRVVESPCARNLWSHSH